MKRRKSLLCFFGFVAFLLAASVPVEGKVISRGRHHDREEDVRQLQRLADVCQMMVDGTKAKQSLKSVTPKHLMKLGRAVSNSVPKGYELALSENETFRTNGRDGLVLQSKFIVLRNGNGILLFFYREDSVYEAMLYVRRTDKVPVITANMSIHALVKRILWEKTQMASFIVEIRKMVASTSRAVEMSP